MARLGVHSVQTSSWPSALLTWPVETALRPPRLCYQVARATYTCFSDVQGLQGALDTGNMLGGPPRKDPTDQRVFNDEPSESMEKLQKLETEKTKRMEETEAAAKKELRKEKRRVEQYEEEEEEKLQKDIESLRQDAKTLKQEGAARKDEKIPQTGEEQTVREPKPKPGEGGEEGPGESEGRFGSASEDSEDSVSGGSGGAEGSGGSGGPVSGHEFLAQSRIIAPPYLEPTRPEDEIPVAVATTQEQWRRQRIAKDQVQVAQDQMQLAKDTRTLAKGQDKLTNLRTPGVEKEELLAEQVRDQKRIALDQELLVQSQKRLAEDMDSAIDGKLRWERLEDYRKRRIEKFQDMVNDKLNRLYKAEIDFVKRGRKGKLRGAPLEVPDYGQIGLRVVSGAKAALATGGSDGSEVFQEDRSPEEAAEEEAMAQDTDEVPPDHASPLQDQPVMHSGFSGLHFSEFCWLHCFLAGRQQQQNACSAYSDFFPNISQCTCKQVCTIIGP